jgi:hypothetical protein
MPYTADHPLAPCDESFRDSTPYLMTAGPTGKESS